MLYCTVTSKLENGVKLSVDVVETDMLIDGAVTNQDIATVTATENITTSIETVATVSGYAASGGIVKLSAQLQGVAVGYNLDNITLSLYRGSTLLTSKAFAVQGPYYGSPYAPGEVSWPDTPSAGTYTYYLKANSEFGGCTVKSRILLVEENLK